MNARCIDSPTVRALACVALLAAAGPFPHARAADPSEALLVSAAIADRPDPPPDAIERVRADLAIARAAFPALVEVRARAFAAPGRVDILATRDGFRRIMRGEVEGFDELNRRYGPLILSADAESSLIHLQFDTPHPAEPLIRLYAALPGVEAARPLVIGGDGSFVTAREPGRYAFHRRWGDCRETCAHEHVWEVVVADGRATLAAEHGDPVPQ